MKRKILLVHDEPALITQVISALKPQGYDILLAFDNNRAWETIAREQPDLVILDESTPPLNFLDLLQQLRKSSKTASILVLLLILPDPAYRPLWRRAEYPVHPDMILTRPFNPLELAAFVKRLFKYRDEGKV